MSDAPAKKSDLGVRVVSAIVMVAIAGGALWAGGWIFKVFVGAIALGMLWEWWRLIIKIAKGRMALVKWALIGAVYILVPSFVIMNLGSIPAVGVSLLLPLVAVVIGTDVGAYFAGRAIGGPKIAPSISPSKTWAGLIGGMTLAGLLYLGFNSLVNPMLDMGNAFFSLFIGGILAIVAQCGDFFESWMKRKAGVKDSSNLIPGHGGLLDRLDGLLAVTLFLSLAMLITFYSVRGL